jgi:hypothetical protein
LKDAMECCSWMKEEVSTAEIREIFKFLKLDQLQVVW